MKKQMRRETERERRGKKSKVGSKCFFSIGAKRFGKNVTRRAMENGKKGWEWNAREGKGRAGKRRLKG